MTLQLRLMGIDLLKIIAMLGVVIQHEICRGGWGLSDLGLGMQTGVKGVVLAVLDAFCECAVNCFVLASGWVMCRLDFKFRRILRLWGVVVFYSLAFVVIAKQFFPSVQIGMGQVLKAITPIRSNSYWFFTQYVGLFFTMPILNVALNAMDRKVWQKVVLGGFILFSIVPFVLRRDPFLFAGGYSFVWFAYLYLVAGGCALHGVFDCLLKRHLVSVALGCVVLSVGLVEAEGLVSDFVGTWGGGASMKNLAYVYSNYNSPILLIQSVSLLGLFSKLNPSSVLLRKILVLVVPSVFSVYIIHENVLFREMTSWNNWWVDVLQHFPVMEACGIVILGAVVIFSFCIVIDLCRRGAVGLCSVLVLLFGARGCNR